MTNRLMSSATLAVATACAAILLTAAPTADAQPAPSIEAPADGASGIGMNSQLRWRPVRGALNYEVGFRPFGQFPWESTKLWPSEVFIVSASEWYRFWGQTVEWAVRSCNGRGCGPWSEVRRIRFDDPPDPETPTFAMANNTDVTSTRPLAATVPLYTAYLKIFVADRNSSMRTFRELDIENRTRGTRSQVVVMLQPDGIMPNPSGSSLGDYWGRDVRFRIQACNDTGCSAWSPNLYLDLG